MYSEVIYGPPGTGKSTYLVSKVNTLLERGISPKDIVVCSFTKNAAKELKQKLKQNSVTAATIHSLAFSNIEMIKEQMVNGRKLKQFSDLVKIPITNTDNTLVLGAPTLGDQYLTLYHLAGNTEQGWAYVYSQSNQPNNFRHFTYFCSSYERWKSVKGYKDFNDILKEALESGPDLGKDYIIVDEAQDLTSLQWKLIFKWVTKAREVYLAGDDDQAIYTWAGANVKGMSQFRYKYGSKQVVLGHSKRLSLPIYKIAEKLISQVQDRVKKNYEPNKAKGFVQLFHSIYDLNFKSNEDCLILYRNHSLRQSIEDFLISKALPYTALSGKKGILDSSKGRFIRLWKNLQGGQTELKKSEETLLKSVLKERYTTPEDIPGLLSKHWSLLCQFTPEELSYFRRLEKGVGVFIKPSIKLNTIHGSKGSESERVVLINGMTRTTMETLLKDRDGETRVFYVGITRAKTRLDLVMDKNPLEFFI